MSLSNEVRNTFHLLMDDLLGKKENFRAIFSRMAPVINYDSEFFVAFFMGYVAHTYKQLFLILANRDMHYEEINEMLDLLISKEPEIREVLTGMPGRRQVEPRVEPQREPEYGFEAAEETRSPETINRVSDLASGIHGIRGELDQIKKAMEREITRYEIKLVKAGQFKESILRQEKWLKKGMDKARERI